MDRGLSAYGVIKGKLASVNWPIKVTPMKRLCVSPYSVDSG